MPIFEYRCSDCGEEFELLVLTGSKESSCPACGSTALEKAVSLPAVSSEHSREHALRKAKERAGEARFDKEYHEHQAEHNHEH